MELVGLTGVIRNEGRNCREEAVASKAVALWGSAEVFDTYRRSYLDKLQSTFQIILWDWRDEVEDAPVNLISTCTI